MTVDVQSPRTKKVDPSRQQQQASDPRQSVWVNASAGSGKTTVLTKRVMRLLLGGTRPERILCLTFTRAAAAEMSIRVTTKLSEWVTCDDATLDLSLNELQGQPPTSAQRLEARRLFARALSCPGGLRIRTIHSFAQEILRRFPIEAGLPPHFTVLEEADAKSIQEQVITDLLRNASSLGINDDLERLTRGLGEERFSEAVRNLLHQRQALQALFKRQEKIENILQFVQTSLGIDEGDTSANLLAKNLCSPALPENALHEAGHILLRGTPSLQERGRQMLSWFDQELEQRIHHFDTYRSFFLTQKNEPLKLLVSKNLATEHPTLLPLLTREAERLQALVTRLEILEIAELTAALLKFGYELIRHYQKRKNTQAALDYDDLIDDAHAVLSRPDIAPWILFKLDGGLDHILVDEAQDTSRIQWDIIRILADEFFTGMSARDGTTRTLFVVGDEKQSIFSFQNADPAAFAEMRSYFQNRITKAQQSYSEIPLSVSFRSAQAILETVDTVFAQSEARQGVSSTPVSHKAYRQDKRGRVELWPILETAEITLPAQTWLLPEIDAAENDPQQELADHIATKIKGWLDHQEILPGEKNPISPGDIMILLRRRGRFADLMVRALKKHNIPVTGVDRMHLIEQLPVMDLLALLNFTLLPEDDLNLATVLRGPLLSLDEEDLMALAIDRPGNLWQNLGQQSLTAKYREAFAYLSAWLNAVDFLTPFELLVRILNEPCPANIVSGRQAIWSYLGMDALDPLEELLNAAQNFGQRHAPSLQKFLHWLSASNSEIKREMDQGSGQVRIMTVHASKGLEAPIVFLPDTTSLPRAQDIPKFQWSSTGLPLYLNRKPLSEPAAEIWLKARDKQLEEYRRLFYVALTRAANRLYVGGWKTQKNIDFEHSWYRLAQNALTPPQSSSPIKKGDFIESVLEDPVIQTSQTPRTFPPVVSPVADLPTWAFRPPLQPETNASLIHPSKIETDPPLATPDSAYTRGRLIHRLLQSLPDLTSFRREEAARRYLANPQHQLSPTQQTEIIHEVLRLLQDPALTPIFGPHSHAEVPIVGFIENKKISGQIDRLVILDHEVWIIDYKTNRPPPTDPTDIPINYLEQMKSYASIIRVIYHQKHIRCFLIWTYGPQCMEIPPERQIS